MTPKKLLLAPLACLIFGAIPQSSAPAFAQNSDCSITLSSGRKIDLTSLCGAAPASFTVLQPSIATASKGEVTLGQWQFRIGDSGAFNQLVGTAINTGNVPVTNVQIYYQIYDGAGNMVDKGSVRSEPSSLGVGVTTGFKALTTNKLGKRATISEVRWNL